MGNGDGEELRRMGKLLEHLAKATQVRLIALIMPKSTGIVDDFSSVSAIFNGLAFSKITLTHPSTQHVKF